MAKKLSLFLEDNSIKVLLCEDQRVLKWANLPLEPGMVTNGAVADEEKLAALLKQQLEFLQIKEKWAIVGLTGLNSLYRIISLPQIPDNLLAEAVNHEAERVMPVAMNDVFLAYQPIPGKPEERRIFLTAFPKASAESLVRTIRKAGMEPYLMDLAPLALSRNVSAPRAVILCTRGTSMDIVVLADRIPQVIRSLLLPTEAESQTEKIAAIAEEVERTIAFYNQNQQVAGQPVLDDKVPVLVSGDMALIKDNWDLVSSRLGHPVAGMPSPMEEISGFDSAQFMINIGLILKEAPREKTPEATMLVNFNVLPASFVKKPVKVFNIAAPVGAVIGVAAVGFMGYLAMGANSNVDMYNAEATSIQKQITAGRTEIKTLQGRLQTLQAQVKPLQDQTAVMTAKVESLKVNRGKTDANTHLIVESVPEKVTFTEVNYNEDTVVARGVAPNVGQIYDYARSLRSSNYFTLILTDISVVDESAIDISQELSAMTLQYEFTFTMTTK